MLKAKRMLLQNMLSAAESLSVHLDPDPDKWKRMDGLVENEIAAYSPSTFFKNVNKNPIILVFTKEMKIVIIVNAVSPVCV